MAREAHSWILLENASRREPVSHQLVFSNGKNGWSTVVEEVHWYVRTKCKIAKGERLSVWCDR